MDDESASPEVGRSSGFLLLTTVDSLLLVTFGVLVARLSSWPQLVALGGALIGLVVVRWLLAAPARKQAAEAALLRRWADRGELAAALQEAAGYFGHTPRTGWSRWVLSRAVQFWFDEDLAVSDMDEEEWEKRQMKRSFRSSRWPAIKRQAKSVATHPGYWLRWQSWKLDQRLTAEPGIANCVWRLGPNEVADILIRRGKAEGFITDRRVKQGSRVQVLYSLESLVNAVNQPHE